MPLPALASASTFSAPRSRPSRGFGGDAGLGGGKCVCVGAHESSVLGGRDRLPRRLPDGVRRVDDLGGKAPAAGSGPNQRARRLEPKCSLLGDERVGRRVEASRSATGRRGSRRRRGRRARRRTRCNRSPCRRSGPGLLAAAQLGDQRLRDDARGALGEHAGLRHADRRDVADRVDAGERRLERVRSRPGRSRPRVMPLAITTSGARCLGTPRKRSNGSSLPSSSTATLRAAIERR